MHSKNSIGNRNVHSKLPIVVFQINLISSIESEEFRETSNNLSRLTVAFFTPNSPMLVLINITNRSNILNSQSHQEKLLPHF